MCQGDANCSNIKLDQEGKYHLLVLRILLFLILGVSITHIVTKNYELFSSSLILCIIMALFTICLNFFYGFILILSFIFSILQVLIFYGLRTQNSICKIPETIEDNKLKYFYIMNSICLVIYIISVYYTYYLTLKISDLSKSGGQYSTLNNSDPENRSSRNYINLNENNNTFRPFSGNGSILDN